jgi:hypothetical protein
MLLFVAVPLLFQLQQHQSVSYIDLAYHTRFLETFTVVGNLGRAKAHCQLSVERRETS